ncbi:phosphoribosyltransferase-like protein [Ferrovibrio sp.]|uniref:phosphoribosyltransferase-like protein n=1 Tax=Ferrovibrio sp. TaxID=1917215 RepID=UPI003D0DBD36
MKKPQGGVNPAKLTAWVRKFSVYRRPPSRQDIQAWLGLFKYEDQTIAIRILDNLLLVSETNIQTGYRSALQGMEGWHGNARQRTGRWYFCGYAKDTHESGQTMLRMFAEANRLQQESHRSMFVSPRELPQLKLTAEDTLIFVDDVSGSGNQVVHYWPTMLELIASEARAFLVLTAVTQTALAAINANTELEVVAQYVIDHSGNVFHDDCKFLTAAEKKKLLAYCQMADAKNPQGYGNCGLLLVLSHKTPNNTIPVIYCHHDGWQGIFPRHLPLD